MPKNKKNNNETNISSEPFRPHQCCEVTGCVTEKLEIPKRVLYIGGIKIENRN